MSSYKQFLPIAICVLMPHIDQASAANIEIVLPNVGNKLALVLVKGEIFSDDGRKFAQVTALSSRAIVIFDSPGGAVRDGLAIGATIRMKDFATLVGKNAVCASACALAWLGGGRRYMQDGSKIGFHAAYINSNGFKKETGMANAVVGAYLNEIGISVTAIEYITKPAPDEIQWLTFRDALLLGISVRSFEKTDE